MSSKTGPYVFLIDIDGTLIGDITPQVCEWEILSRFDKKKLRIFRENLIEQLKDGLLRPGFSTFIDQVRSMYPNSIFYVYTASDAKWATFIVPCIEFVTGVKFSRPLFTRQHCVKDGNDYKKSIYKVTNIIHKKLNNYDISPIDLYNNTVLIDNTRVLAKQEEKRLIHCSTYDHVILRDVTRTLDYTLLTHHYKAISHIMASYNMFPVLDHDVSFHAFLALQYKHLYYLISHTAVKKEKSHEVDNVWYSVGSIISKYAPSELKDALIRTVNEKLRKA